MSGAASARTPAGCEESENSRNRPVTTKATCSPMSTALSPIRSSALATSVMCVAHPLDVLDRVKQRRDQPQVTRHGGLQCEQREDSLVHLQIAPVDPVVVGDHHLGELHVLVLERLEDAVQLLYDQIQPSERMRF